MPHMYRVLITPTLIFIAGCSTPFQATHETTSIVKISDFSSDAVEEEPIVEESGIVVPEAADYTDNKTRD